MRSLIHVHMQMTERGRIYIILVNEKTTLICHMKEETLMYRIMSHFASQQPVFTSLW